MPDQPELPTQTVTGGLFSPDEFWQSNAYYAGLYQQLAAPYGYESITNYALDTLAGQPNLVELDPGKKPAPPREDAELDEQVIEGREVPLDELRDDELREIGSDDAIDELRRRRGETDGSTLGDLEEFDAFLLPPALFYPAVGTLSTLGAAILAGLGFILLPQPTAPRELDEAPTPPKPPKTNPPSEALPDDRLPFLWPRLPDFPEPGPFPFAIPDIGDWREVGDPQQRRVLPISDDPGMFDDPAGLPDFPFPQPFPQPDTRPRPAPGPGPDRFAPFPFGDPVPSIFIEPERPFAPFPDIPVGPFTDPFTPAIPKPDVGAPPKVDVPLPGNPFFPDTPYAPPDFTYDPFAPFIPAPDPQGQPKPDKADKCDCTAVKTKPKKKKPSKPREICYEGHYVEHARGLTKKRGKQIPCTSAKARAPRSRAPNIGDLARDVFQLP